VSDDAHHLAAPASALHRGPITVAVMLATFIQALDATIANVALPRIQGSLSATQDQMTWVLTSYIIACAVTIPLAGWLAGQIGRKRVIGYSVGGFTLASLFCGFAQTMPEIIAARLFQGMCGAALVPISQAILLDINPPARHARAMAIWAMGATTGPIVGPLLGGWLTEHYSWRWVFFINLPFGLLSLLGILTYLPESKRHKSRFDFFGFIALSLAVGALQLFLDRGQLKDWFNAPEIWIYAVTSATAFYLFVVHILTTNKPAFVSPGLFKDLNFLAGLIFIFVGSAVLFSNLALLPTLMQELLKYPVLLAGELSAPRGIGTLIAMLVFAQVAHKVDARYVIGIGFALLSFSLWQLSGMYLQITQSTIMWSGLAQGIGTGLVFVPLATVTFATLAPRLRNEGTSLFSLMRNIGSSVGISIMVIMQTRQTQTLHSRLAEKVTPFADMLQLQPASALHTAQGLAMVNDAVTAQAAMLAYDNVFNVLLVLSLCAIPFVALLRVRPVATHNPMAGVE
jgi:DHA2 family multidrug resistance protein